MNPAIRQRASRSRFTCSHHLHEWIFNIIPGFLIEGRESLSRGISAWRYSPQGIACFCFSWFLCPHADRCAADKYSEEVRPLATHACKRIMIVVVSQCLGGTVRVESLTRKVGLKAYGWIVSILDLDTKGFELGCRRLDRTVAAQHMAFCKVFGKSRKMSRTPMMIPNLGRVSYS